MEGGVDENSLHWSILFPDILTFYLQSLSFLDGQMFFFRKASLHSQPTPITLDGQHQFQFCPLQLNGFGQSLTSENFQSANTVEMNSVGSLPLCSNRNIAPSAGSSQLSPGLKDGVAETVLSQTWGRDLARNKSCLILFVTLLL